MKPGAPQTMKTQARAEPEPNPENAGNEDEEFVGVVGEAGPMLVCYKAVWTACSRLSRREVVEVVGLGVWG